ncbi:MAG: ATP-binding protein [Oceanipulchritudo sp.]
MIRRNQLMQRVQTGLRRNPIVALIGPRQCGKTTLARAFLSPQAGSYFDLEDPFVAQAFADPMSTLVSLRGLVVIDEAQRRPEIFPTLRVLADRSNAAAQFLILGSASPDLSRQASESLAGRVEVVEMGGFQLDEVAHDDRDELWLRGGFPRAFLAASQEDSYEWRRQFIRMFLERDLAQLGFGIAPSTLGRFWTMLAHHHGQLWNGSEIAASMGISPQSSRNYLDALEQTFMVRRLLPWHANVGKRLVKSPKIYFRDSGIFHALQGIADPSGLIAHPKLGASWEGFAIEQLLQRLRGEDAYFYAVHSGSELDLYLPLRNLGIEIKRMDAPKRTRSMDIAIEDLKLERLLVVYPGSRGYELSDRIRVVPLAEALG